LKVTTPNSNLELLSSRCNNQATLLKLALLLRPILGKEKAARINFRTFRSLFLPRRWRCVRSVGSLTEQFRYVVFDVGAKESAYINASCWPRILRRCYRLVPPESRMRGRNTPTLTGSCWKNRVRTVLILQLPLKFVLGNKYILVYFPITNGSMSYKRNQYCFCCISWRVLASEMNHPESS
jgi:hypothetical protein